MLFSGGGTSSAISVMNLCHRFYAYATASYRILAFYYCFVLRFGRIHADLDSGKLLSKIIKLTPGESLSIKVNKTFKTQFNEAYIKLRSDVRKLLLFARSQKFESLLMYSFIVRGLWAVGMWLIGPWAILAGIAQFIVAPMSLVISFLRLQTNWLDAAFHYAINALAAKLICQISLPKLTFTLNLRFLLWFLAIDFVLNVIVYISTSQSFGAKRLMKHILYGTYNTKTYFVVVIGYLCGLEIDVWVWLLTGILTRIFANSDGPHLLKQALRMPCFQVLFYCEHRINHCPVVYGHAHKQHHYLHDSTAFDAHIYGSGMNEEWFWIMAECLPPIASGGVLMPYFLNLETLYQSFINKGGHTRSSTSHEPTTMDYDMGNFHADHHTCHNKNFGSATCIFMDKYFGTAVKGAMGKECVRVCVYVCVCVFVCVCVRA